MKIFWLILALMKRDIALGIDSSAAGGHQ